MARTKGTVPVLLMNPSGEDMAAKKKTARRNPSTRSKRSAAAKKGWRSRRRSRSGGTKRRRMTRRRNPSLSIVDTGIATLGGGALGAGVYFLEGQDMQKLTKDLIAAAVGIGGGAVAAMFSPAAGAGLAGAGGLMLAKGLMEHFLTPAPAPATQGLGRIPNYAAQKFGMTQGNPRYFHMPYAQLNAVEADLGAVQADLNAIEANLY